MNTLPASALQKEEDYWLEDGNVVLIARGTTAFRVHRGVLSRYSEVFRQLFTLPQPTDQEMMFGCPCIHLPDSPVDLRYLLRVIYDGGRSHLAYDPQRPPRDFVEVAALVRLSHKYRVEDVLEDELRLLKTVFTDDFSTFSTLKWQACPPVEEGWYHISSPFLRIKCTDAIIAVDLARVTANHSMLPAALYMCSLLPTRSILRGVPLEDGSMLVMSPRDMEECVELREVLSSAAQMGRLYLFHQRSANCTNYFCDTGIRERLANLFKTTCSIGCDFLWKSADETIDANAGTLCRLCIQSMKFTDLEWRMRHWEELPSNLNLGSWRNIEDSVSE